MTSDKKILYHKPLLKFRIVGVIKTKILKKYNIFLFLLNFFNKQTTILTKILEFGSNFLTPELKIPHIVILPHPNQTVCSKENGGQWSVGMRCQQFSGEDRALYS